MVFNFSDLQSCLAEWPDVTLPGEIVSDSLIERVRQILVAVKEGKLFARADFQPLIRHLLLRESSDCKVASSLRVPSDSPWPSAGDWNSHGVATMRVGGSTFLLTPEPWHPDWISGDESGVFSAAFTKNIARENGSCTSDPFVADATGYQQYSSPGQREAVRAAFLMPYGHTLIVNLPTGSGKSLVGQAPSLTYRQDGNLTLFVVPTVALAIDQARQMQLYLQRSGQMSGARPLAWYGGLSDADRAEMRKSLLDGTQRILFTSPEALTTSLLRTVFAVVRNGWLRYLVIDEAHLITQWGDEFRPAFQALAGLRNSLLGQAGSNKFRTLLLSATFTLETVETLATLFGPKDHVQMVSAVHLRPEPQYWFSRAYSIAEKEKRVLEALAHAPRPFLLYVTTRKDAQKWHDILTNRAGYQRVQQFDGGTPDQVRSRIIHDWIGNKLDGVVATSAFGVGIDKADVRTVIHAAIPETLDRFYQEVGRGGRDGKPSVSLLVYEDSDWRLPQGMSTPTLISNELGFSRWQALFNSSTKSGNEGLFKVDLGAVRPGLAGNSDENVKWNMRTLLLMSRAGFIELNIEPNGLPENPHDEDLPSSPLAAMASVRIRTLRDDHLLEESWEKVVSPSRDKTLRAGERNLELMQGILENGKEVSMTLADLYQIRSPVWSVTVTRVCGGCPEDRLSKVQHSRYHVPIAAPIHNVVPPKLVSWKEKFPYLDPRFGIIFYGKADSFRLLTKFVKWLISECDVQEVCVSEGIGLARSAEWRQLYRNAPSGVVVHRTTLQLDEEPYSPLARVTIFDQTATAREIETALMLQRPMHLVFLPIDTADPRDPNRSLSESPIDSMRLEQLLATIDQ